MADRVLNLTSAGELPTLRGLQYEHGLRIPSDFVSRFISFHNGDWDRAEAHWEELLRLVLDTDAISQQVSGRGAIEQAVEAAVIYLAAYDTQEQFCPLCRRGEQPRHTRRPADTADSTAARSPQFEHDGNGSKRKWRHRGDALASIFSAVAGILAGVAANVFISDHALAWTIALIGFSTTKAAVEIWLVFERRASSQERSMWLLARSVLLSRESANRHAATEDDDQGPSGALGRSAERR
jgi:hypothetical protein